MYNKRIPLSFSIGQQGINLIEKIVLQMGFLWSPRGPIEAGIDGIIEICDPNTGNALNSIIQVQSKATNGQFTSETNRSFEFVCKREDIEYWLHGNVPVILVVSRPISNEAYWISIKDYFNTNDKRTSPRILFNKTSNKFDFNCRDNLLKLGIQADNGIYFTPLLKSELLYTNLLELAYFEKHLYIAETEFRTPKELWPELNRLNGNPIGGEWILKEKRLISFHDLREYPWNKVCDMGTIDEFSTNEWAFSDDIEKRRDFVRLLNLSLKEKTKADLAYNKKRNCYYFKPTPDLQERRISYYFLEKNRFRRTIFKGFESKTNPGRIAYYRHNGFIGKFYLYGGIYYLEISPTYYFTSDGYRISKYFEERLSGIKRFEKNPNVLVQLIMWKWYLTKSDDMFSIRYPYLKFGELERVNNCTGINDKSWISGEEEAYAKSIEASLEDLPLFQKDNR